VRHNWGPDGPPPDAYSHVTAAERFQPLHGIALNSLQQLEDQFDVERNEGHRLDIALGEGDSARPSVRLTPADPSAAPILVTFTAFPGLRIRCGRWLVESFPTCGCDACAEDLEGEHQRFLELIENVVAGRFRELITLPWFGAARQEWELWSSSSRRGGGGRIKRAHARELVGGGPRSFEWSPWRLRRFPKPQLTPGASPG